MASQNLKYVLRGIGKPLEASVATKPTTIESTEVMIRLKAVAINPADYKTIDKGYRVTSWPTVLGLDGSGVVEAVGTEVQNFAVGDEVLALFTPGNRSGSFQNLAVVDETKVARKPPSWSFEEASTLAVCYFTAAIGLAFGLKTALPFLKDGPATGATPSSVLILGGGSALGGAAIQLLCNVLPDCTIVTTSSPKHHTRLTSTLGATKAINRSSPSPVDDIKSATPGSRGVDAILDLVGAGATERHVFDALDPNGPRRYAQVWTGDEDVVAPAGVDSVMFKGGDLAKLQGSGNVFLALQDLLAEGKYKLPVAVRKVGDGLDKLPEAMELMRKGVSGEKLVVTV